MRSSSGSTQPESARAWILITRPRSSSCARSGRRKPFGSRKSRTLCARSTAARHWDRARCWRGGWAEQKGMFVKDDPDPLADLFATIYKKLGIDYEKEYISNIGRPFKLADKGKPIDFLLV